MSLLMAISGNDWDDHAFSFHRCFMEGGTTLWQFFNFMTKLFDWLAANCPGRLFLFTMDNLNIHRHPVIYNLIHALGHCVVFAHHIGLAMDQSNLFSLSYKHNNRWMYMVWIMCLNW